MRILLALLLCALLHVCTNTSFGAQPIVRFANPDVDSAKQSGSPNEGSAKIESPNDKSAATRLRSTLRRAAGRPSVVQVVTPMSRRSQQRQDDDKTRPPHVIRTPKPPFVVKVAHQPEALPTVPETENKSATQLEEIFFDLKPIDQVTIDIRPKDGEVPHDIASDRFARMGRELQSIGHSRPWHPNTYAWMAPRLAHRPLYFEDVNLERHGYHWSVLQPAVSAAHFFGRLPAIPYMRGAYPPRQQYYTLGNYRPGSQVPFYLSRLPVSLRGALMESGAIVSGFQIIP